MYIKETAIYLACGNHFCNQWYFGKGNSFPSAMRHGFSGLITKFVQIHSNWAYPVIWVIFESHHALVFAVFHIIQLAHRNVEVPWQVDTCYDLTQTYVSLINQFPFQYSHMTFTVMTELFCCCCFCTVVNKFLWRYFIHEIINTSFPELNTMFYCALSVFMCDKLIMISR